MAQGIPKITFEGCRLGFKNFAGEEGPYNRKGDRNFVVFLPDLELANELADTGWNVKFPKEVEGLDPEEDTREPYLPVALTFGKYPPRIVLISGTTHQDLDEETVNVLDWARIVNCDLIVRPYQWTVNGDTGIKAYLDEAYITVEQDGFKAKYGF